MLSEPLGVATESFLAKKAKMQPPSNRTSVRRDHFGLNGSGVRARSVRSRRTKRAGSKPVQGAQNSIPRSPRTPLWGVHLGLIITTSSGAQIRTTNLTVHSPEEGLDEGDPLGLESKGQEYSEDESIDSSVVATTI